MAVGVWSFQMSTPLLMNPVLFSGIYSLIKETGPLRDILDVRDPLKSSDAAIRTVKVTSVLHKIYYRERYTVLLIVGFEK